MKKIKTAAGILLFCALFLSLFYVVDTTLKFKNRDGIRPISDLYHYPDDCVDVLFLGSSHIGVNIDTEQLCNEYGIAAYKMWGPTQPTWSSYYGLVEVLKTQSPKVVVFETLSLSHEIEYQSYSEAIMNTMGMKFSKNKIDAINAAFSPEYRADAISGFATYHSRYASLEPVDFSGYEWDYTFDEQKNIKDWYAVYAGDLPSDTKKKKPLGEKEELYLKKILRLCEKKEIPILFVSAPYSVPEEEQERMNTVREFLAEEGYDYLDYITDYEEIGIDFQTDFGDSAGHLNSYGIEKFTGAVGAYLKEHYELPEKYGDPYFAYSLPKDAVYVLQKPFEGDAQREFVDTGVSLYSSEAKNWTILTKIDTECDSAEKIYFSCFKEEEPYAGVLVRKTEENELDVVVGNQFYAKVPLQKNRRLATFAMKKSGNLYSIYLDGQILYENVEILSETHSGTLTLASQWLPNNQLGKLSAVGIEQFEVYEKDMPKEEILQWMEKNAYIPSKEETEEYYRENYSGNLNYTLGEPFEGNGNAYVDTGVQLFCEPERDWTLFTTLDILSEDMGVYLSCFSEDPENYRGLLIRRTDEEIQFLLGGGQMLSQRFLEGVAMDVVITKEKDLYTVYINGNVLGTVESPCDAYVAPLMVGCELDENYQPFRQSMLKVKELAVREGIVSPEEIAGEVQKNKEK